jgi:preprotein translocase subunit SecE
MHPGDVSDHTDSDGSMTNMAKEVQGKEKGEADASAKPAKVKPVKKVGQPAAGKKAEVSKKSSKRSDESRVAWFDRFREYLREVSYELRKVVWPSRKETIGTTSVVLIIVLICGVYLGIIDYILSLLVGSLLG